MFLSKKSIQKNLKLLPIDFTKPWWQLIVAQKWVFFVNMAITAIKSIFLGLSPFLIAQVLESMNMVFLLAFFVTWLFIEVVLYRMVGSYLNIRFQLRCIHSIHYNAHSTLLTIDPQYHVYRSSGAILGKIDRAARGYEDLLDQISWEFLPLLTGLISMIVVLGSYSWVLATVIGCVFIILILGGYCFARYVCNPAEKNFLASDDEFRSAAVENLAQIQLIRATFASDYMSKKLAHKVNVNAATESRLWMSYVQANGVLNIIYILSVFAILIALFWQIDAGITSTVSAIGLVLAYINSTKDIVDLIKPFRRYLRGWNAVNDLFTFIPTFGKETYPVLGPTAQLDVKDHIFNVDAQSISFDYETAKLFNNHSLHIHSKNGQTNKLYGIIGPSGSGKTTLLSILGGQLKPVTGTVVINGVDIYGINDATRRTLIALQGQISTSLKGTIKYNLLFGLPSDHGYDDHYLRELLIRVGLWAVLANGLETLLGEGGLNLSGGQRQRLNFAGLYVRARYYKPVLILIDEPTSSLDELSEAAITDMINELAHSAVTLVIAHRLKTVEKAVGLIDLSLLVMQKVITPYTSLELEERSLYYRQLLENKINLDS